VNTVFRKRQRTYFSNFGTNSLGRGVNVVAVGDVALVAERLSTFLAEHGGCVIGTCLTEMSTNLENVNLLL
jgi:hypothetical protein